MPQKTDSSLLIHDGDAVRRSGIRGKKLCMEFVRLKAITDDDRIFSDADARYGDLLEHGYNWDIKVIGEYWVYPEFAGCKVSIDQIDLRFMKESFLIIPGRESVEWENIVAENIEYNAPLTVEDGNIYAGFRQHLHLFKMRTRGGDATPDRSFWNAIASFLGYPRVRNEYYSKMDAHMKLCIKLPDGNLCKSLYWHNSWDWNEERRLLFRAKALNGLDKDNKCFVYETESHWINGEPR